MADERIFDKLCFWLETKYDNYVYQREDFRLQQSDDGVIIVDWNLEEPMPDIEVIKQIDLTGYKKPVVKNSMEDIIRRLEALEKISGITK